jgi:hypothetical protein
MESSLSMTVTASFEMDTVINFESKFSKRVANIKQRGQWPAGVTTG